MMPGDVMAILITVLLPTLFLMYLAKRFFSLREKQLEVQAMNAAEKAAQYAAGSAALEERVRVLEQIVTDGGAQTAAQIEALRKHDALSRPPAAEPLASQSLPPR